MSIAGVIRMARGNTAPAYSSQQDKVNARGLTRGQAADERHRVRRNQQRSGPMSDCDWTELPERLAKQEVGKKRGRSQGIYQIPNWDAPRTKRDEDGSSSAQISPFTTSPAGSEHGEDDEEEGPLGEHLEIGDTTSVPEERDLSRLEKMVKRVKTKAKLKAREYIEMPRHLPEDSDLLTRTQKICQRFINYCPDPPGFCLEPKGRTA